MTDELKVAVVPGDDAAPEAVHAVMTVLHAMELPIAWEVLPDGVELARSMPRADGEAMVIDAANRSDTVLFGSTSGQTPGVGYFRWGAPDLRQRATDQMATRLPLAARRA